MGIGIKLQSLLETNRMNVNELAKKISVSPQTIYSMIKRDSKKADIEVLLKIAEIFGVTAEYFVNDDFEKDVSSPAQLRPEEEKLLSLFNELNVEGQEKATEYVSDLVATGRYIKSYKYSLGEEDAG